MVNTPSDLPEPTYLNSVEEPYILAQIITKPDYIGPIMNLCLEKRGLMINQSYLTETRVEMSYHLPLAEIVFDFYDKLKAFINPVPPQRTLNNDTYILEQEIKEILEAMDQSLNLLYNHTIQDIPMHLLYSRYVKDKDIEPSLTPKTVHEMFNSVFKKPIFEELNTIEHTFDKYSHLNDYIGFEVMKTKYPLLLKLELKISRSDKLEFDKFVYDFNIYKDEYNKSWFFKKRQLKKAFKSNNKKRALADLLKELVKIDGIEWIRLHYAFPTGFPLDVLEVINNESKVCNYLDIPLQHINDDILKSMKRGTSHEKTTNLIAEFRKSVPNMAIRTTLIVGYPGETEENFQELKDWVQEMRFERLGAFAYSHEENTTAADLEDDVPEEVKQQRVNDIMELQSQISWDLNQKKIGKTFKVVIDRKDGNMFVGRTEFDSPDVDNEVLIDATKHYVQVGKFANIKITEATEFDLYGEPCS